MNKLKISARYLKRIYFFNWIPGIILALFSMVKGEWGPMIIGLVVVGLATFAHKITEKYAGS